MKSDMASIPFTVVDVFSTEAYKGNALAIVDNTSNSLTDVQMKLVARQFNLSETTFFMHPQSPSADFSLRSFLPDGKEVFGAGHNILGVWWFLAANGKLDLSRPVRAHDDGTQEFVLHQELGGQVSPVSIFRKQPSHGDDAFSVSITQVPPQAHAYHPDVPSLAQSVGLGEADVGFVAASGKALRPQVMSTSTTRHLMVPVSTTQALDKVQVQRHELLRQLSMVDEQSYGIYLFTRTDELGNYQARFFSPGMSGEDPATGSAAGPLSKYLEMHGDLNLVENEGKIRVVQGLQTGRRCTIDVVLSVTDEGASSQIVGRAVEVMGGTLRAPSPSTEF